MMMPAPIELAGQFDNTPVETRTDTRILQVARPAQWLAGTRLVGRPACPKVHGTASAAVGL